MRYFLLALALLAGLKIWVQSSVYRSATEEALVAAYRDRAREACQGEAQKADESAPLALAIDWTRDLEAAVQVGDPSLGVYIWQVEDPLWGARFKSLFVVLKARDAGLSCFYDVAKGGARISKS